MASKDKPKSSVAQFEKSLQELDQIVQQLEGGDLELEQSLQLFERGMALSKGCKQSLDEAELKVRKLLEQHASDANPE